jgi:hypothetical protein
MLSARDIGFSHMKRGKMLPMQILPSNNQYSRIFALLLAFCLLSVMAAGTPALLCKASTPSSMMCHDMHSKNTMDCCVDMACAAKCAPSALYSPDTSILAPINAATTEIDMWHHPLPRYSSNTPERPPKSIV